MAPDALKKVAILQGNATVAQVMSECLESSDFFEVELLRGSPPGAARAQLAIIDVDSGIEAAEQWIHHCDGRQLPVLVSGVERSRDAFADRPWLSRPFSGSQLINLCHELLGASGDDEHGADEIPPPIEVGSNAHRTPTVEVPTHGADLDNDAPPTQNDLPTARVSPEELLDVIDLDGSGSMILEVEEISDTEEAGGKLTGSGRRRSYDAEELVEENPWADEPDTAVEGGRERESTELQSRSRIESSSGSAPALRAEVTAISPLGDMASNDFSGAHRVASLVAEHWDQLGLTARPTDRAERLQRVLTAMLRQGLDGVLDELKRIPPVSGFSGCLQSMPVVDLLHTIRDRRLRGRLEVGLDGHSFVLYIDRTTLQGIDSLGENTAGLLIEFLRKNGALDDHNHRHYRQLVTELSGEPLEMKLRRDGVVDDSDLMEAKTARAKYLLGKMCQGKHGTFAFIDVPRDGGQAWPTQGLNLNVDALLLELYRKGTLATDQSGPVTRSDLVIDIERASQLAPETLTESERRLLAFFEDGQSIEDARDLLGDTDESVDQVIQRLKRLELLRRLGQNATAATGADQQEATRRTSISEVSNITDDPQKKPTAVESSWDLQILDEVDTGDDVSSDVWADPAEETEEDVGFSLGVPDDFSRDKSTGAPNKVGREPSQPLADDDSESGEEPH